MIFVNLIFIYPYMNIVTHLKTGNEYTLHGIVIDATNSTDGRRMALYSNSGGVFFVREISEFMEKFEVKE